MATHTADEARSETNRAFIKRQVWECFSKDCLTFERADTGEGLCDDPSVLRQIGQERILNILESQGKTIYDKK